MQAQSTPPASWTGSKPEWAVYSALVQLGYEPGRDFTYQASVLGGRLEYGGAVLDFVIPSLSLAINVQSIYYHYEDITARRRDALARTAVEGLGIRLIYIDEEDALANPVYYVEQAIMGIDHSRMATF